VLNIVHLLHSTQSLSTMMHMFHFGTRFTNLLQPSTHHSDFIITVSQLSKISSCTISAQTLDLVLGQSVHSSS